MDRWIDGQMDGWIDGQMDRWIDRQTDEQIDRYLVEARMVPSAVDHRQEVGQRSVCLDTVHCVEVEGLGRGKGEIPARQGFTFQNLCMQIVDC